MSVSHDPTDTLRVMYAVCGRRCCPSTFGFAYPSEAHALSGLGALEKLEEFDGCYYRIHTQDDQHLVVGGADSADFLREACSVLTRAGGTRAGLAPDMDARLLDHRLGFLQLALGGHNASDGERDGSVLASKLGRVCVGERRVRRNERCPCGSELKFKRCCGR